jgi:hypothetical protein
MNICCIKINFLLGWKFLSREEVMYSGIKLLCLHTCDELGVNFKSSVHNLLQTVLSDYYVVKMSFTTVKSCLGNTKSVNQIDLINFYFFTGKMLPIVPSAMKCQAFYIHTYIHTYISEQRHTSRVTR